MTIHRLLQLPIEHEGKTAGYWWLGKDAIKVIRSSLSQLRVLVIDEVSNLNLAYVHLCLDEIFGRDQWFGGVNVLFVWDLPAINGAPVFDRLTNKSVASKLGCMTSFNIWQYNVLYDEFTINESQKKDQVFSFWTKCDVDAPHGRATGRVSGRCKTGSLKHQTSLRNYWLLNSLHWASSQCAKRARISIFKCCAGLDAAVLDSMHWRG